MRRWSRHAAEVDEQGLAGDQEHKLMSGGELRSLDGREQVARIRGAELG